MDKERLIKLKQRAEKAIQISNELELLNRADPHKAGVRMSFTNENDGLHLESSLLTKVIADGRLKVIADKEAELESLLSVEQDELPL